MRACAGTKIASVLQKVWQSTFPRDPAPEVSTLMDREEVEEEEEEDEVILGKHTRAHTHTHAQEGGSRSDGSG